MIVFLFGLFCGATGCLLVLAKMKQKKNEKSGGREILRGKSFFLNIEIVDKSEAIKAQVEEK